ncbi:MAG: urate hydroxylase PuuD [Deltaproteobacteria bacterium]|nr:urate hydroxylase PuuD [Deltaproteobacteria bacterium]
MDAHFREVLELLLRWVHLIAGIMWIGNSMLFNWLDRNLVEPEDKKPLSQGEIWMVHSGGFYQVEKKLLPPHQLPRQLHWFMYQNLTTWVSGVFLLLVIYYLGGRAYMVDPAVSRIATDNAIALGVGTIVVSWLVYDTLWRSPLGKRDALAAGVSLGLLGAVAFGLCQVLSGRAAYIHVGVVLGTVMTGNVWFRILPAQTELVEATRSGRDQDPALGYAAKQRSIHNNYMTFPLLFIMLSNHYPSTFGGRLNWVVLAVLMAGGAGVRHFMNIRFWYRPWLPALAATAGASVLGLWALTRPAPPPGAGGPAVPFHRVQTIIEERCVPCHSVSPTDTTYTAPPNGVLFDTPEEIVRHAERIRQRAVVAASMPLGNKTGMTQEERDLVGRWVAQGARRR